MNVPFAHGIASQGSALCLEPGKALVNIAECHVSVGVSKKLCLYPMVAPPVLEAAERAAPLHATRVHPEHSQ